MPRLLERQLWNGGLSNSQGVLAHQLWCTAAGGRAYFPEALGKATERLLTAQPLHASWLQGTKSLERCFSDLTSKQLRALRDDLLRYQARGGELPKQLWPYKLIQQEKE